jgi:hypothetical protein
LGYMQHAMKLLHKWLNRRSGRKSFTWERLKHYLSFNPLPTPVCCAKSVVLRSGGRVKGVFVDCESEYNRGAREGKLHAGICAGGAG